ncbi:MAG: DNA primase small subunit domain-containing protein [Candidatus Ranarchaeia archaeon]
MCANTIDKTRFLRDVFHGYYRTQLKKLSFPTRITERELAFFPFEGNFVKRHIGFSDHQQLLLYLRRYPPRHAYFSAAYFDKPDGERMDEKGWRGADLIFDIDADHFETQCRIEHDRWSCNKCGTKGKGVPPKKCPRCGAPNSQIKTYAWLCENCLSEAKNETIKLVEEYLETDLGIAKKDMIIVFSGHRGYHVHVHNRAFEPLGSAARREIIDYVTGNGIKVESFGLDEITGRHKVTVGPAVTAWGWRGRLARGIIGFLRTTDANHLSSIEGLRRRAKFIMQNRDKIIQGIQDVPPRYAIKGLKIDHLKKIAEEGAKWIGSKIDVTVTGDVHRLIRLPGSLHGKTGFRVVSLSFSELERFDPFRDVLAFRGTVRVHVKNPPPFRIGDHNYVGLKDEIIDLPTNAAVFLLAKGIADFQGVAS